MKEFVKKNLTILIAFALPVVLIIFVALNTYLPSLFLPTGYNFIYASCVDETNYYQYQCSNLIQERYSIVNNKLVINDNDINQQIQEQNNVKIAKFKKEDYKDRIFLYDTRKNEAKEITLDKAKNLMLSDLYTSPDGVAVLGDYERDGNFPFIFGGRSSYGYYLTKGKSRKKLNIINGSSRYSYLKNFQFIGWVLPERN